MATKKFSALSTGTTANAGDIIPIERSGSNLYVTPLMLQTYMLGNIGLLARYHNSANITATASAEAIINFNTLDYDPLTTVTTGASWHFTAPVTGWYDVRIVAGTINPNSAGWTEGEGVCANLYKNGSLVDSIAYQESYGTVATDHFLFLNGTYGLSLSATDTVALKINNFSSSNRLLVASTGIEIYRVH